MPNQRAQIRAEVDAIDPFDGLELAHRSETIGWINSGAELCRIQKPDIPPKHLIVYGVLMDGEHILLVDHINAGLWLPAGGHVDAGEHPKTAVLREVGEELGLSPELRRDRAVFLSVSRTVGKTAGHTDVALWYAVKGNRRQEIQFDGSEFHRLRWFRRDDVPVARSDPHMARFLAKLSALNL